MAEIKLVKVSSGFYERGHQIHFVNENGDRMIFGGSMGYDHSYVSFQPKEFDVGNCNIKITVNRKDTPHFSFFTDMLDQFIDAKVKGKFEGLFDIQQNGAVKCLSTSEAQRKNSHLLISQPDEDTIEFEYNRRQPAGEVFTGNSIDLSTRNPVEYPLCKCAYRLLDALKAERSETPAVQEVVNVR
ncbi:MAG: hypothetical protein FWE53_03830 [Firmicutes bacterium]|nr:hypothetical protein [Bacillota bacterium]